MTRLANVLVLLRIQLWILPAVMCLAALGLALFALDPDLAAFTPTPTHLWWLFSGDAATARNLLSSLLSGLMTMASLIVSVTFVTLSLAANQLGPRLITTFMADRQIQAVLGLFLGTILYVLVILRSINETIGPGGVPHIAVTIASILTLACLFALLFYVHKIARSIIADTIIDRVAHELHDAIRSMLPEQRTPEDREPLIEKADRGVLSLERSGYIQTVDYERLVATACVHDAVLRVEVRPGHFILRKGVHVRVLTDSEAEPGAVSDIRSAFVIGSERTPTQDLEYAIRQLVEIALRAMSPGINDMFTAIAVIDRLGAGLEDIFSRGLQSSVLRDDGGDVRVIASRSDIGGVVSAAFDPIRQAARNHPAVLIRCADIIGQLAQAATSRDARDALGRQLDRLRDVGRVAEIASSDCDAILARVEQARVILDHSPRCAAFKE